MYKSYKKQMEWERFLTKVSLLRRALEEKRLVPHRIYIPKDFKLPHHIDKLNDLPVFRSPDNVLRVITEECYGQAAYIKVGPLKES